LKILDFRFWIWAAPRRLSFRDDEIVSHNPKSKIQNPKLQIAAQLFSHSNDRTAVPARRGALADYAILRKPEAGRRTIFAW
jgi:hypothetical protein